MAFIRWSPKNGPQCKADLTSELWSLFGSFFIYKATPRVQLVLKRQSMSVKRAEGPLLYLLIFGVSGNGGWDKLHSEILLLVSVPKR